MDYSQLHDVQINMMVCKALGLELSSYARIIMQGDTKILLSDNKTMVDYCNNPADAWRILNRNRIEITVHYGPGGAQGGVVCYTAKAPYGNGDYALVQDTNHLRAGMVAFLIQQDKS